MIRILDLDNCISDDHWRIPYIDWQHQHGDRRYDRYHLLAGFDHFRNSDLAVTSCSIAVLTARPVAYRCITEEWLRRHHIRAQVLLMRNANDVRPSAVVKRQQVLQLFEHYDLSPKEIECAYDDRQDVIDMYQDLGIKAQRRWIHDTCAMTPPPTNLYVG